MKRKKKVALSEGLFLFVDDINLNRIGQFGLKRKTGSVLCRIALWDVLGRYFFLGGEGGGGWEVDDRIDHLFSGM